jgi:hypothetical protein
MVKNVMTSAFKLDNDPKMEKTVSAQIAARQQALADIDSAKFGWYHVRYFPILRYGILTLRAIMVAGSGFFTDAYDIFSINMGMFHFYRS